MPVSTGNSIPCGTPTQPTVEPGREVPSAVPIDWFVPTHALRFGASATSDAAEKVPTGGGLTPFEAIGRALPGRGRKHHGITA